MLIKVIFPHAEFNAKVRDGTVGRTLARILDDQKPEAVYFTETCGKRSALLVVDLKDASRIPSLAEPWFLNFQADVHFQVAMNADDLKRAGLEELGKKWG